MPLTIRAGKQACAQPGMQIVIVMALVHKLLTVQYGLQLVELSVKEQSFSKSYWTYLHSFRLKEQHARGCALPDAIDADPCAPKFLHAYYTIKKLCKEKNETQKRLRIQK